MEAHGNWQGPQADLFRLGTLFSCKLNLKRKEEGFLPFLFKKRPSL
jgi:hypothetical protein